MENEPRGSRRRASYSGTLRDRRGPHDFQFRGGFTARWTSFSVDPLKTARSPGPGRRHYDDKIGPATVGSQKKKNQKKRAKKIKGILLTCKTYPLQKCNAAYILFYLSYFNRLLKIIFFFLMARKLATLCIIIVRLHSYELQTLPE